MMKDQFELVSEYEPSGDQPVAIKKIVESIEEGQPAQVLLGGTGTGKTFTMANVIAQTNRPTLVLAHNKTLAGQLYGELKEFFPNNAVEYFVSYYDYYQPEAYVPSSDSYIEKSASVNDEIDKLRHSATSAILERRDTIIVASVSCIYGLVNPAEYREHVISIRQGQEMSRDNFMLRLVQNQYERNDIDFQRGTFRVRGDIVDVFLASHDSSSIRVEFFGDEIDRIREVDALTGEVRNEVEHFPIYPATHFVVDHEQVEKSVKSIEEELEARLKELRDDNKLLEAQRLEQRTRYDIEMLLEMGYCNGIENYSRHMDGRQPGEAPYTLLDFFPEDFLLMVDESHMTMPQVRGMYNGDKARKQVLIDHGFRLPSALDNRPLRLEEFEEKLNQALYVSATPADYEVEKSGEDHIVQQIIRPTGLLDPTIEVRPIDGQIDDLIGEINTRIERAERVFITTMTKRMAEDLTDYLEDVGIKVKYLHSDIKTLERTEIIRDLRLGVFDVLVGINLLREGIDVPEVSLVAILDADKEGFLRNERSLIQTIGRAARNQNGHVIMYGDHITDSMRRAMDETARRRGIQEAYNEEHGIVPKTIKKDIRDAIRITHVNSEEMSNSLTEQIRSLKRDDKEQALRNVELEMKQAAKELNFEKAAELRDIILELKAEMKR
ncbi:excinuclease ABC subunit UvrB [Aerococcus agrisoli]|uniref:UvrABC system protein B n=1 Tax=Aerococcus agrisoli TaxID=2487350 RepID=A0A3N4GGJ3_9LACT|nr:excinuclease ABC subunit UvrB [Aerococcus agrisoli]RPA61305.1 excinuclease ABC subunit UvrB [Aerococcus agrisoli]